MESEEKSFLQEIWENRFVKFIVPYAIGAWGVIQVAAFLESRYSWAQNWPDFILVFALILLPSVLLFSHARGASKGTLTKTEKFFIPINLLLAIVIATFGFGKSDLKNTASKVQIVNEEGEKIERIVPNISTIKRITILPWENKTKDTAKQWMAFALPEILSSDLEQDNRVIGISPKSLSNDYSEYSLSLGRAVPFSVQRKIAVDNYSDYFLNGSIEKTGENYIINTSLFSTKDGKEYYSKKYENTNPIDVIDLISEDFRKEIYIENELDKNFIDLPVSNLYTSSLDALKFYSLSLQLAFFNEQYNYKGAVEAIKKAIAIDPNFAVAYAALSDYSIFINEFETSKEAIKKAMQLKDALSERMQLSIKYGYMRYESQVKALSLLEMWSKLYPLDYKPYGLLIQDYQNRGEAEKAKQTALRALENGHSGPLLLTLATLESVQGNQEKAEEYYTRFANEFPHKAKDISGIGNVYMAKGDFDKAEAHFEQLHLMNPDKASIIKKLAEIQGKKGNFGKKLEKLDEALALEKQFQDSVAIMMEIEKVYLTRGQVEQYFAKMENRWQLFLRMATMDQIEGELLLPYNIEANLETGKTDGLLDRLLQISGKIDKSIIDYDCVAKGNFYIYTSDAKNLKTTMEDCLGEFKKLQTDVQMNIVYAFMEKVYGNYDKAIEHLKIIEETSGLDPTNLGFFCEIYRLNKQYDIAEKQLESIIKTDPYNPKMLYQLALTYEEQGKIDKAKSLLQRAIDIWKNADTNYIPAQKARAKMAELN